jgi:hypothetical protein
VPRLLLYIMSSSPEKTRTKADLRDEAIERFKVSKSAFDLSPGAGRSRRRDIVTGYEPLPRSRRKVTRTLLA